MTGEKKKTGYEHYKKGVMSRIDLTNNFGFSYTGVRCTETNSAYLTWLYEIMRDAFA